jgi:hypothetical protein
VNPLATGGWNTVSFTNDTKGHSQFSGVVELIPKLEGKEELFRFFGTTKKEESSITLDAISMRKGHKYYIGVVPDRWKKEYVDQNRHINNVEAFSTLPNEVKLLYVQKVSRENNDLEYRFKCDDPTTPFGMLDFLYLEQKPKNLYKLLDKTLKEQLGIEQGVRALKLLIIGENWDRWLSDDEKNVTLARKRPERVGRSAASYMREENLNLPYGILNTNSAEWERDPEYVRRKPQTFVMASQDENGRIIRHRYFLSKFVQKIGDGNYVEENGFYMFYPQDAVAKRRDGTYSENYLKGKYMEIEEGEEFIREKTATGELRRI